MRMVWMVVCRGPCGLNLTGNYFYIDCFKHLTSTTIRNEKIIELRRRLDDIMRIPRDKWNQNDIEFMKLATEPKMLSLLHSLK